MSATFRIERDSMGEMQVPADAYYAAQTARALENFPISGCASRAASSPRQGTAGGGGARSTWRSGCCRSARARPSSGGHRGGRGALRRPVRRRRVPDRVRHVDEHELQRGDRQPRDREARRGRAATTSRCTRTTT